MPAVGKANPNFKALLLKEKAFHESRSNATISILDTCTTDCSGIQSRGRSTAIHPVHYSDSIVSLSVPSHEKQRSDLVTLEEFGKSKLVLSNRARSDPTLKKSIYHTKWSKSKDNSILSDKRFGNQSNESLQKIEFVKYKLPISPGSEEGYQISSTLGDLQEAGDKHIKVIVAEYGDTSSPFHGLLSNITDDSSTATHSDNSLKSMKKSTIACGSPDLRNTMSALFMKRKLQTFRSESVHSGGMFSLFSKSSSDYQYGNDENSYSVMSSSLFTDASSSYNNYGNTPKIDGYGCSVERLLFCQ